GGVAWLLFAVAPAGGVRQLIGLTVYGAGLIGMFVASAAYNSCRPCRAKELLRRVDHAMIFVMIAGTCTPFALLAFPERPIARMACRCPRSSRRSSRDRHGEAVPSRGTGGTNYTPPTPRTCRSARHRRPSAR